MHSRRSPESTGRGVDRDNRIDRDIPAVNANVVQIVLFFGSHNWIFFEFYEHCYKMSEFTQQNVTNSCCKSVHIL